MAIPDYQSIMLPLLTYYNDNKEHHIRDSIEYISNKYKLTEEERNKLLPSGKQQIIDNRVGWARTYLKKAGLLETTRRGYAKITKRGKEVLEKNPEKIDNKFLKQFPEFIEFKTIKKEQTTDTEDSTTEKILEEKTPIELMDIGHYQIIADLSQDLLNRLRENHFSVLEHVVLKLLTNMGYGEGKVVGKTGDGGVDGFIDQDKLGLDKIFFQAKRYDEGNTVTSSQLRDFIGALDLKGMNKGVFITTSRFPKNADEIISKTSKSITLIDGAKLAKLMIEYNIGVSIEKEYKIRKLDTDFFEYE